MAPLDAPVVVVDDDDFTRTLVTTLVQALGYEVCGKAASVTEAMTIALQCQPPIAVIDLDLGEGPTGVDLAHGLRKINPNIALVMLTSYGDPVWMGQKRELPPGAHYVVKGEVNDPSVLGDAIARALTDPLASQQASQQGQRAGMPLSEGQWEILRLVAGGYSNAEIAKRQSLTVDAVNKAITRLVKQLDIEVGTEDNTRVLLTQTFNRITGTVSERRS